MDGTMIPHGAGGGGSAKSSAPTEAPNTLQTRMTAKVLYLVSRGPISGLGGGALGEKRIFLNDTAVLAADGTKNMNAICYGRLGDADQPFMEGFPTAETNYTGPGLVKKADDPIAIRTIDMTGRDRMKITIMVRALYLVDGQGNITNNSVIFRIEARPNGASLWTVLHRPEITGKCVAPYVQQYSFGKLNNGLTDIRIVRETIDPPDSKTASEIEWSSYTAVTDQKMTYPGAAYFGISYDAEKFPNGIPTATFELGDGAGDGGGFLCEVPSNWDPVTRVYSGIWDGTFQRRATDNPAWIFWTLATNPQFGAGTALSGGIVSPAAAYAAAAQMVDRWFLYSVAQYCDEMIPNGLGGTEPRYRMNIWLNSAEEAYRVLSAIASTFRGLIYWGRGQIIPVIDRPSDPVKLVTSANVVDGLFRYEGTAYRARHSVVRVRWRDPQQGFREAIEVVEDGAMMREVGYRVIDYEAVGCIHRSQARRMGRWVLFTEKYETGTVAYAAAADHANANPGDVILIQDAKLAGIEFSGRMARPYVVNGAYVYLDRTITLQAGVTYTIQVVLADGTISPARTIANGAGARDFVNLTAQLPSMPVPEAVWIITASNVAPVPYRVLGVEEADEGLYNVLALRHYPGKSAFIELGLDLNESPFTIYQDPQRALSPPTSPKVEEYLTGVGTVGMVRVVFSWTPSLDNRILNYEAQALQNGVVVLAGSVAASSITFNDLVPGSYVFQVRSVGDKSVSPWVATISIVVDGVTDPPSVPTSLTASGGIRSNVVRWANPTTPQSRFLRTVEVWASSTSTFSAGGLVGESPDGQFLHGGLSPLQTWYYWIRSADTFGQFSGYVGPVSATTSQLIAADIQDGILDTAKFASTIKPVELIANLSVVKPDNTVALNQADGQLYRRVGGAWTAAVPAVNVTGQLTDAQIAAVAAAKVSGQLTNAQLADIAATKVSGQLTDAQIAAIAATKVTGQLTNAQLADIAATKVTGMLTDAQIADLAATKVTGQLVDSQLAGIAASKVSGALAASNFPATLRAVEVVATLPSSGNFEGRIAYLTTDDKLYRHNGTTWIASVATTDLSGTLTNAQIASLDAAKLTGAIVGTQITDGAITTPKLAAGAVTANEIAANAITAAKVDAGAITTAKLAAGAVTANEIATNAITAGKVAAGAIAADQIQAGAVTAGKLLLGDRENLLLNPSFQQGLEDWARINGSVTAESSGLPASAPALTAVKMIKSAGEVSLTHGGDFNTDAALQFGIAIKVGDEVYAEGWIYDTTGDGVWFAEFIFRSAGGAVSATSGAWVTPSDGVVAAGVWTKVAKTFVSSTEGRGYLRIRTNTGAGTVWMTGLVFRRRNKGELIVDGAITANKIAANAITAAKIDAGAITTAKIAAGAVTTANLAVGQGRSTVWNACCPLSTAGWSIGGFLPTAIGRGIDLGADWSLPMLGNGYIRRSTGLTTGQWMQVEWSSPGVPCVAGQWFEVQAMLAPQNCQAEVHLTFWNAAGGFISEPIGNIVSNAGIPADVKSLDRYTKSWRVAQAPVGAVRAWFYIRGTPIGPTTSTDPYVFWTMALFGPANPNQTEASDWAPGGVTEIDGGVINTDTIITRHIAAGAITADELAANSVTAGKVSAGAITAGTIAAGVVTANELAANSVVAGKVSAGAITTGTIAAGAVTAEKLTIGSGNNICWNPVFGDVTTGSTDGWFSGGSAASPINFIVEDTVNGLSLGGRNAVLYSSTMAVGESMYAIWAPNSGDRSLAVAPGQRVQASVYAQAHRCTGSLVIDFYNAAGTALGAGSSTLVLGAMAVLGGARSGGLGVMGRIGTITTAPAGAVVARAHVLGVGTGEASPQIYLTHFMFGFALPNQAELDPFTPGAITSIGGGVIKTDSITARHLIASAVTAGKIAANAVTAGTIEAGAITAGKLSANAVTAGTIAANAVTFGTVAAGAIRSAEIATGELRAVHMAAETIITSVAQMGAGTIGIAQIGDAAISNAKIGDAQITTLKVAGQAITTHASATWGDTVNSVGDNAWRDHGYIDFVVPSERDGFILGTFSMTEPIANAWSTTGGATTADGYAYVPSQRPLRLHLQQWTSDFLTLVNEGIIGDGVCGIIGRSLTLGGPAIYRIRWQWQHPTNVTPEYPYGLGVRSIIVFMRTR